MNEYFSNTRVKQYINQYMNTQPPNHTHTTQALSNESDISNWSHIMMQMENYKKQNGSAYKHVFCQSPSRSPSQEEQNQQSQTISFIDVPEYINNIVNDPRIQKIIKAQEEIMKNTKNKICSIDEDGYNLTEETSWSTSALNKILPNDRSTNPNPNKFPTKQELSERNEKINKKK